MIQIKCCECDNWGCWTDENCEGLAKWIQSSLLTVPTIIRCPKCNGKCEVMTENEK